MAITNWICPECDAANDISSSRCICGHEVSDQELNRTDLGATEESSAAISSARLLELIKTGDYITKKTWISNFTAVGISLALFLIAGLIKADLMSLFALILAILIHECGHLLAMRMAGYKNLQILFIPFLGGLAAGSSTNGNADNEGTIALAGPFLGLLSAILSGVLFRFTGNEFFHSYTKMASIINAANLLPIYPLDGGRFFNALLFTRFPKIEIAFKILAAALLSFASFKFADWTLLLIVLVILFSIRRNIKSMQILKKYSQSFGTGQKIDEETIAFLQKEITARNLAPSQSGDSEKNLALQINRLLERISYVHATAKGIVILVFFYILSLIVLPVMALSQIRIK